MLRTKKVKRNWKLIKKNIKVIKFQTKKKEK